MSFFPCDRCGRMPRNCPCIRDPLAVRQAQARVAHRHQLAVARARRWDRYRKAAA